MQIVLSLFSVKEDSLEKIKGGGEDSAVFGSKCLLYVVLIIK